MATAVATPVSLTNGKDSVNGAQANGKVKSKNQLRRLKAKQKKAEQSVTPTPVRLRNVAR